jgi:prefoldin beta subunit
MSQEKIQQLSSIDSQMQVLLQQKQQFQNQLFEVKNAVSELGKSEKAYKIVGNIMVLSNNETLQKDLAEKQEILELRVKNIEKQEAQLKEKADELRKEVFKKAE